MTIDSSTIQGIRRWIETRPRRLRPLIEAFPPGCEVMAKEGVTLPVPAPGVKGVVQGYSNETTLRVAAPLAEDAVSPVTGAKIRAGTLTGWDVAAVDLECVAAARYDGQAVTTEFVRETFEALEARRPSGSQQRPR